MSANFNFSDLNDEAKVNRSHIAQSINDPNVSNLTNAFNKSQLNPQVQVKKNEVIFPAQNFNGLQHEERKTINSKDPDALSKSLILQSKSAVQQAGEVPQLNELNPKISNVPQNSNQLKNFGLQATKQEASNQLHHPNVIVFPAEKENYDNKSVYSFNSKDLENSRINQNNITNSIHEGAHGVAVLNNSNFPHNLNKNPVNNHFDPIHSLPNKENSAILNTSNHNIFDPKKINLNLNKNDMLHRNISNIPFPQNLNNANPLDSHLYSEEEINENDIMMMEEKTNNKITGNSLMEEVRIGAYGGQIHHPTHQSKFNDTESIYEDAKSELNSHSNNPIGAYGNIFNRHNATFNDIESNLFNEESKKNIFSENKPENYFNFTLKKNSNMIVNEEPNLVMSGNPYFRNSAAINAARDKFEWQNKSINDLKNLDKSRASQNPLTPNLKFKEDILGKSALDLEFNQNQSEFILLDKKQLEEEIFRNQRDNSFFSPYPNQKKNFENIFYNMHPDINDSKNFNLNEDFPKSRALSISNIDKNNLNHVHLIPTTNDDYISHAFNPNSDNKFNDHFFSDPDEENIKNNNFKHLLETEHSKGKLDTRVRNDTNVNNFLDVRPDNSHMNISVISKCLVENQRKDTTDTIDILKIPKPNKPSNSVINNTVNYGNKIKTIFDEPNEENPNFSNNNLRKISIPNNLNKTTNLNPNNLYNTDHERKGSNITNPNNININSANVVNYYNFNFNNNYKVNHDTQINDLDLTLENKSIINPTLPQNTILKTEILETEKLIQEEEKQNKSLNINEIEPEILVEARSPVIEIPDISINQNLKVNIEPEDLIECANQTNLEDIHYITKISEEKLDETIFENSIVEIRKPDYKQLKRSAQTKPNVESLTNYYSHDFLQHWNETAVIKIANNKKGVREDKYFIQGFLNEFNLIDAVKNVGRDYIQSLDELNKHVYLVYKKPESTNVLEIEDLFSLQDLARNSKNTINHTKKKEILDFLQKKATKTTFNKISYLYDNEILKQKYRISNEKIFFEAKDETTVFTSCINRNMDRDLISQLNNMNNINNEFTNKKNLSIINEVDSVNETKRVKTIFNKEYQNDDGRIHLWRESICDGNSFYRMFMFGYLEHLIFDKNISLLAKLFKRILLDYANRLEINKSLNANNQLDMSKIFQNLNIERVLVILNIITNQMRIGDYPAAYKSLINAFNDDDFSFDRVTCFSQINNFFIIIN